MSLLLALSLLSTASADTLTCEATKGGRPKKVKSLCSMIHSAFNKLLTDDDVKDVLNGLKKKQWIGISGDDNIAYQF